MNGFALKLVLKQRHKKTRKSPNLRKSFGKWAAQAALDFYGSTPGVRKPCMGGAVM